MNNKLIINYDGETAVHPAYYIKEILDTKEMTLKELSNKIMPIGAKRYQSASNAGQAGSAGSSEKPADGEPVEGEVVDK